MPASCRWTVGWTWTNIIHFCSFLIFNVKSFSLQLRLLVQTLYATPTQSPSDSVSAAIPSHSGLNQCSIYAPSHQSELRNCRHQETIYNKCKNYLKFKYTLYVASETELRWILNWTICQFPYIIYFYIHILCYPLYIIYPYIIYIYVFY